MKAFRLALNRDTFVPVIALLFASGVCFSLVIARIVLTRHLSYAFLVWNLALAWLPLFLALLACDEFRQGKVRQWRFMALSGAWLLFFPNAPYIFTDIIHLKTAFTGHGHFWVDLVLILSCAVTGLVLGFLSLYLMHSVMSRVLGPLRGWLFTAVV